MCAQLLVKGDESPWKAYGRYELLGIGLDGGRHLRNLGMTEYHK